MFINYHPKTNDEGIDYYVSLPGKIFRTFSTPLGAENFAAGCKEVVGTGELEDKL